MANEEKFESMESPFIEDTIGKLKAENKTGEIVGYILPETKETEKRYEKSKSFGEYLKSQKGSIESPFIEDTVAKLEEEGKTGEILGYMHPEFNSNLQTIEEPSVSESPVVNINGYEVEDEPYYEIEGESYNKETSNKVKESWMKKTLATAAVTVIIATAMGAALNDAIKEYEKNEKIEEAIASRGQVVADIVDENRGTDIEHKIKYYDTYKIAQDMKEEGLTDDEAIFHVYCDIRRDGVGDDALRNTMNTFVRKMGVAQYFRDYVVDKGFVDKYGAPDFEAYNKAMRQIVEARYSAAQIAAEHSIQGGR